MEINKPKQKWQLSFEGDWSTSVTFLGDSHCIAAGNRAGQIFVWELAEDAVDNGDIGKQGETPPDFAPIRRLDGHTNGITHLRATPDGQTLISASLENELLTDRARELAERLCTGDPLERAVDSILASSAAVDRS